MIRARSKSAGSAMIEALVAILVTSFALLALANLQGQAMVGEVEAYGRSQALVLAQDMVNRISANRSNASSYVLAGFIGGSADCPNSAGTTMVDKDLCEWKDELDGVSESKDGKLLGGATAARGCIVATTANSYLVVVVWQGSRKTSDAINPCADTEYPADGTRRALSLPLTFATLGT